MPAKDYATTAADNTAAPPNGAPEGATLVSQFNEIVRLLMARLSQLARDTNGTLVTEGSGNAYTLNTNATYTDNGNLLAFRANHNNTGAATLAVDGQTAVQLRDASNAALSGGEIVSGRVYLALFNGSHYQLPAVRQHGDLGGGTLHALATPSASGFMSATDKTKVDSVTNGAQPNPTAVQIKTDYESNADTNAFTDALLSKLNSLTSSAGFQTGAEVLTALTSVDGAGSGLDADLLDGLQATDFARALHTAAQVSALQVGDFLGLARNGVQQAVPFSNLGAVVTAMAAGRTAVSTDANRVFVYEGSGDVSVSIDTNTNMAAGTSCLYVTRAAGRVQIVTTGVTLLSPNGLRNVREAGGTAMLLSLGNNRYQLAGHLV